MIIKSLWRRLGRFHRVAIAWLHEQIPQQHIDLKYEVSERQAAYIFTKAFTDQLMWGEALSLINMCRNSDFISLIQKFQNW